MVRYIKSRLEKHFDSDLPTMILLPKAYADEIEKAKIDWGHWDKLSFKNWGAGIGSNQWKDYEQMLVVGLFHPNKNKLQTDAKAHSQDNSVGEDALFRSLEEAAVHVARRNWHTRWVVQMLNRICIRQMHKNSYVAKGAKIVWIATPKDAKIVEQIMLKNFENMPVWIDPVMRERMDEHRQTNNVETEIKRMLGEYHSKGITEVTNRMLLADYHWWPSNGDHKARIRKAAEADGWAVKVTRGRYGGTTFTKPTKSNEPIQ
jgi:hypothetical protein